MGFLRKLLFYGQEKRIKICINQLSLLALYCSLKPKSLGYYKTQIATDCLWNASRLSRNASRLPRNVSRIATDCYGLPRNASRLLRIATDCLQTALISSRFPLQIASAYHFHNVRVRQKKHMTMFRLVSIISQDLDDFVFDLQHF